MDENISRAAGAAHGQKLDEAELARLVASAGRRLRLRTTLYDSRRRRRGLDLTPTPASANVDRGPGRSARLWRSRPLHAMCGGSPGGRRPRPPAALTQGKDVAVPTDPAPPTPPDEDVAALRRDLDEAREQLAATGEILAGDRPFCRRPRGRADRGLRQCPPAVPSRCGVDLHARGRDLPGRRCRRASSDDYLAYVQHHPMAGRPSNAQRESGHRPARPADRRRAGRPRVRATRCPTGRWDQGVARGANAGRGRGRGRRVAVAQRSPPRSATGRSSWSRRSRRRPRSRSAAWTWCALSRPAHGTWRPPWSSWRHCAMSAMPSAPACSWTRCSPRS